ncbi:putative CDP-diacylglycerol--glycerol-3-phosphate 3-phosphatidyltransferase [Blattamonas nauphoetae]|uniref:CDP-diacylglycerol--glycerol-3-phosphate 3-phosphatidyltransferase n=1 Tax=Blattamonas nauphoetae TaxID=2049346 RepID=A0ABQ9Y651_9EUKA|nr:putative CDP-diacylglycerol--glycerol-3-phosphate 3-phosphatidyltransferase [Blattamonas nauphoetae]
MQSSSNPHISAIADPSPRNHHTNIWEISRKTVPTLISLFRLIIIPVIVLIYYFPFPHSKLVMGALVGLGAFSDFLDGYLARRFNTCSKFGAFVDPITDKIFVNAILILHMQTYHTWIVTVPTIIMVSREIIVTALREWMAQSGQRDVVGVKYLGKVKTATQMVAVLVLIFDDNKFLNIIGFVCLQIAAILSLVSMFQYIQSAIVNRTHTQPTSDR